MLPVIKRFSSSGGFRVSSLFSRLSALGRVEAKKMNHLQQRMQESAEQLYKRNWSIDSQSGSSKVLLQHRINDDEFISIFIEVSERGDVQHCPDKSELYTFHCVHNIGILQSPSYLVKRQLVYSFALSTASKMPILLSVGGASDVKEEANVSDSVDKRGYPGRSCLDLPSCVCDAFSDYVGKELFSKKCLHYLIQFLRAKEESERAIWLQHFV
ncbi:hypothetical protein AV274_0607 [Blastocystis sp. ATCC 50177/Nand II]|uniref:Mitochondrial glycoprotein n=1 Tax=Blastocystis sp. subtype 1 (strain ATCC 50177 / NandII) TaxID=478820 RepID=A0A196SKT3_BLAHN|nr:hypothetical protein AV274_0607 [Blastocystis sp. ATCC 50177/Nand II]